MAKSKGSAISKVLIIVIAVILLFLLIAEFGLRWFIGNRLKAQFADQVAEQGVTVEEEPSISFGPTPLLLGIARNSIGEVTVNTPETLSITYPGGAGQTPEILGTPQATVTLKGLNISDTENPTARSMDITTFATDDFILATVQREMSTQMGGGESTDFAQQLLQELIQITDVTSDPAAGAVEVEFTGGAAGLTLRPTVDNGQVSFEVLESQLFGIGLPEEVSAALTEGLQSSVDQVAGGLQVAGIEVLDNGLKIDLTGQNINVRTLEPAA
ncbi:LmeA family phospholipid-binding protein [Corynebacterium pacaense]|uniref:LmeA family phospholipid-binding protein n=1 Tax=Corynebacterium pacaense TaxID=1816684 RepID=UPI0009BC598D|nr:DUF2993 domain-containing protein [Corynebacterium pacaense]